MPNEISRVETALMMTYLAFFDVATEEQRQKSPAYKYLMNNILPQSQVMWDRTKDKDRLYRLPYTVMAEITEGIVIDIHGRIIKERPALEFREVTLDTYYNEVEKERYQDKVRQLLKEEGIL